jgi:lipid-binding SYLF domain-containing protein
MTACLFAAPGDKERRQAAERLTEASSVFTEIMNAGDRGIPHDLVEKAECAVIVPGLKKGAFIVGGQFGKGFITCRDDKARGWSAPAAIRVEGGSVGFQIGGSETDVIMLVMNRRGAERLMADKVTLGAEGEVAAGPVGRDASAQTDAKLSAEMLSWSRSRGVFAGIALKGSTMRPDRDENEAMYAMPLDTKGVVNGNVRPTAEGRALISALNTVPGERH